MSVQNNTNTPAAQPAPAANVEAPRKRNCCEGGFETVKNFFGLGESKKAKVEGKASTSKEAEFSKDAPAKPEISKVKEVAKEIEVPKVVHLKIEYFAQAKNDQASLDALKGLQEGNLVEIEQRDGKLSTYVAGKPQETTKRSGADNYQLIKTDDEKSILSIVLLGKGSGKIIPLIDAKKNN